MLHRPPTRRPRAGGPERPADAVGAQDTALLPRSRAWPRPTARGLVLAGVHAVVASWMAWNPRLQTAEDAGPSLPGAQDETRSGARLGCAGGLSLRLWRLQGGPERCHSNETQDQGVGYLSLARIPAENGGGCHPRQKRPNAEAHLATYSPTRHPFFAHECQSPQLSTLLHYLEMSVLPLRK